jgi:hypothetical protein
MSVFTVFILSLFKFDGYKVLIMSIFDFLIEILYFVLLNPIIVLLIAIYKCQIQSLYHWE